MRPALAGSLALAISVASAVTLTPALAGAQEGAARPFGLGLMIGSPTGLSAKYYMGGRTALQAGLGVIEAVGDDGVHFHLEVVWHPAILTRQPDFTMPFYVGVGGRLLNHDDHWDDHHIYHDDDTHIGVRVPFGILMDFNKVPLDVFLELALIVDLIHIDDDGDDWDDDTLDLNAAIGARYYF